MTRIILAIDRSEQAFVELSMAALKQGVETIQANSMCQGIKIVAESDILAVVINANNINYLPQLQILCDTANKLPVLIGINEADFTLDKQIEALNNGAFSFNQRALTACKDLEIILALSRCFYNWRDRPKDRQKLLYYKNIMLDPDQQLMFVNGIEVKTTTLEYKIMHYFLSNPGRALSYESILQYAWGYHGLERSNHAVFTRIKYLRKKLAEVSPSDEYIINKKGVGYTLRK